MGALQRVHDAATPIRQRGAVLLLVAFALIALLGFAALAIDVGRLYIVKSQLQNAADAGALGGARYFDGTNDGINAVCDEAKEAALQNQVLFMTRNLELDDLEVWVGDGPDENADWKLCGQVVNPERYFFVRVMASMPDIHRIFAVVFGNQDDSVAALAVAGRTICEIMPMFVCGNGTAVDSYGFVMGRSYSFVPSPSGDVGPGNVGYLHPTAEGGCQNVSSIGTPEMQRLACVGQMPCFPLPAERCTVTQPARPNIARAINTRFDDWHGSLPNDLSAEVCPPDKNIREFPPSGPAWSASSWMQGDPTVQSLPRIDTATSSPPATGQQGVWWSFVQPPSDTPVRAPTDLINRPPGIDQGYGHVPTLWVAPYEKYEERPREANRDFANAATQPRRLLHMAIAEGCPVSGGTGSPVRIVAIGKFFMQIRAQEGGPGDMIHGEFAGLQPALDSTFPEIRLYR